MQMKHLIIFALAGIVLLIGFNMFNSNRHESRIAAATSSTTSPATAISSEDTVNTNTNTNTNTDIASQPLGKQPKAILDNATAQIEQAEQVNQERVEQMSDAQ
ncbi:hypothetical protein IOD06_07935 [Psychrobacter sp. N25K4-3-2]|uniref:hypothetical protein n=1 Tax=Psychrobacter sp. N25K4-3-2 TaxID=2785026 RepID=UPI00188C4EEF|nr:hypothetical protein [Psychrobacter sp. N25K4-3-2]MBF4489815.1 hypothetical protein [Psychrobacter sp. N25K4-3-2]